MLDYVIRHLDDGSDSNPRIFLAHCIQKKTILIRLRVIFLQNNNQKDGGKFLEAIFIAFSTSFKRLKKEKNFMKNCFFFFA